MDDSDLVWTRLPSTITIFSQYCHATGLASISVDLQECLFVCCTMENNYNCVIIAVPTPCFGGFRLSHLLFVRLLAKVTSVHGDESLSTESVGGGWMGGDPQEIQPSVCCLLLL